MNVRDLELLRWVRDLAARGEAREIREAARLTQLEVAAVVGTTVVSISRWETGARSPRGEPALRYARLLARLADVEVPA